LQAYYITVIEDRPILSAVVIMMKKF